MNRIPLNCAVVMLVVDVSESMAFDDVAPTRLAAAKEAGKQFADQPTPAINLGLVEFAANAMLLFAPTTTAPRQGHSGIGVFARW